MKRKGRKGIMIKYEIKIQRMEQFNHWEEGWHEWDASKKEA